jgi:myo-inositol-1(or 4)-monophosphatase
VAAGLLMVQEAGGEISGIDGGPLDLEQPQLLASASGALHRELLQVLRCSE